jgi:hypothetical protein
MAGPNSAPNGDRRIVKGDPGEHEIQIVKYIDGAEFLVWVPLRDYLATRGRLVTGKTEGH